ncbi:LysR substrate-binding domain-containing protein [Litorilituus sediminis]|uniref:LysR family transcriptional regulator n=1 Tax=Litorilituus sediminis TaxID=718192 RepID=A0A4P6P2L3_9GAMM|nr:LysR substrate-binding domain-containing protein [Litorilituus sediminis]QBG35384.1 LysR family transcriptional regulator [Litorilituus sediminis]
MDWQGISEFVAVAEHASFTLAAKALAISTAQVSRQVNELEQRLNVKLFYRTTRKVSLTYEGDIFFQHCRQVLDNLKDAENALADLQKKPQGKIKLTAPVTYGEQKILPLINDFALSYPEISIDAHLSNQRLNLVDEGFDLAIRIGKLKDSSLMATKLTQRKVFLCASAQYLQTYGTPHSLNELRQHNCLLASRDYWRFHQNGKEVTMRINGSLRYNNGKALVDAALKGLGIVQLPDYYVIDYLESAQLISILDNYQEPDEVVWAIHPYNRQLSPKVRLLLDYLKEQLS